MTRAACHEPSWPQPQRDRLAALLDAQRTDPSTTWIGYWCSDQWGRASNGGDTSVYVSRGLVQEVGGPLELCTRHALHATSEPHRWRGCRVWIVALFGERQTEGAKCGALRREIIGEILPGDCIDPSIAIRMGLR
ncbi:MAG: hypothetical protein GWN84_13715, partial [Gammaproteobacteria bacterium]|nr:hypothetical protein [Gammaproteobacteria bacterium]NIR83876.1 hypothetical protein [Gammaproteobacteria bacterium]NIU05186.1 hypothetical protein [Gammaproteobacteria bacterium]NIV52034.1 hypothetical protein [Gammaproteobacteria bacterium]NIX86459.1 hypothetical protein [Gammaproteobacteria bacterium]